jgi:hypothetical protein
VKRKIEIPNLEKSKGKKKKLFKTVYDDITFSFITNFKINKDNIEELTEIGRSRWKIENNNFNVLKNNCYNLEHNFGHGNKFLANTLATLNILSFCFHSALFVADEYWNKAFNKYKSRIKFFSNLNNSLQNDIYDTFHDLFLSLCGIRPPPYAREQALKEELRLLTEKLKNYEANHCKI